MKIVKEINATIPTVAYGNIDLLTRVEYDSETDSIEVLHESSRIGGILDKIVGREWRKLHDFVEQNLKSEIASIEYEKSKKKK